jgi:predicted CXXCH cytochrome family protein
MPQSPTCVSCHGAHNVLTVKSAESPLRRNNEPDFCISCHLKDPDILKQAGLSESFISGYESSVHGKARAAGNDRAATCVNCHGAHNAERAQSLSSMINRRNLSDTCGQCHTEAAAAFKDSAHGQSVARGSAESPACTTCHGDHHIFSTQDSRSAVSRANIAGHTCTGCHNSVTIGDKYGIPSDQNAFFADSIHGNAERGGSVKVPNCAGCHEPHNIKSASDPNSAVHAGNLTTTCGRCHPGPNENFTRLRVHAGEIGDLREGPVYWIRSIYIVLIVATIGLMFLHNLLDFIRRARRSFDARWGRRLPSHHGQKQYVRMTALDRVQHVVLLVSFLILVITGFMLRFPDAWWAGFIRTYCGPFFEVRGIVHRAAAVVITAVSLFHVGVLAFTRHGRKFAADMFPKWSDAKDVFVNALYLLGLSSKKPRFDRFSYAEKAEYWALVWGMVIMFASGIFLWFFTFFMNRFGVIGWNIARTIHFYEAILAALAIVVWHFYFVLFHPGIYPMNTAWFNGKISEEEMAEEHPLELERILRQEREAQAQEAQTKDSPEK